MIKDFQTISFYTMLKEIMLSQGENINWISIDNIISNLQPVIFNFDYTIFEPDNTSSHKNTIERLFIQKYLFNDLCVDSFGEWKMWFETEFKEKIKDYNDLWKTCNKLSEDDISLLFNKFSNFVETYDETNTNNTESTATQNTKSEISTALSYDNSNGGTKTKNVFYDTPQSEISEPAYTSSGNPITYNGQPVNRDYATTMDKSETIIDSIQNNESNSTDERTNNTSTDKDGSKNYNKKSTDSGFDGDPLYKKYLELLLTYKNIDNMFIDEFHDMFNALLI